MIVYQVGRLCQNPHPNGYQAIHPHRLDMHPHKIGETVAMGHQGARHRVVQTVNQLAAHLGVGAEEVALDIIIITQVAKTEAWMNQRLLTPFWAEEPWRC